MSQSLAQLVRVRPRFLRSAHLAKDGARGDALRGYILTPQARQALGRIIDGIADAEGNRAWTLTGPYGSGKSSFAVYLANLLGETDKGDAAMSILRRQDEPLAAAVESLSTSLSGGTRFVTVLATCRRDSILTCVLEAMQAAAKQHRSRSTGMGRLAKDLDRALRRAYSNDLPSTRDICAWLTALTEEVTSGPEPFSGVLVMVDELGKTLEQAAYRPQDHDVFLLQEIAELAGRSGATPLVFAGILHQAFDHYGQHLDVTTRAEWAKIQGRFEDVAFQEPPDQMVRLVAQALAPTSSDVRKALSHALAYETDSAIDVGLTPPTMTDEEFRACVERAYPLHPSTLVALPHLFRRFAQNERSLFSYLSSREPHGFQSFLESTDVDAQKPPFVRIPSLFEYSIANFGSGLFTQLRGRRWTEAVDALDRIPDLSPMESDLIKAIGLLGILGEVSHIRATDDVLRFALASGQTEENEAGSALKSLLGRSVVTYRRFSDSYRIWEGSDVDLEERLEEGRRTIAGSASVVDSIESHISPRPIVARRHSYRTGTLRYFELTYADRESIERVVANPPGSMHGRVVCCLPMSSEDVAQFETYAVGCPRDDTVFVIPRDVTGLGTAVEELASLQWVGDNTPEIRDDRTARRELAERVHQVENVVRQELDRLLDPRPGPTGAESRWYYQGKSRPEATSPSGTIALLSLICDSRFKQAPRIWNELINRQELSSNAAAARNRLLTRMVESVGQPELGIEGFPPERSMYESVLADTGIYRHDPASGEWGFSPPTDSPNHGLRGVWEEMERWLADSESGRLQVSELYARLRKTPYGMPDGPMLVLLCALLQLRSSEVALYEEGSFIPQLDSPVIERLARAPETFEAQLCRIEGVRLTALNRFQAVVKDGGAGLSSDGKPELIDIVGRLCRFVVNVPKYARNTKRISPTAQKVRDTLLHARDPHALIFDELPVACGYAPLRKEDSPTDTAVNDFFKVLPAALGDIQHAYDKLLVDIERLLVDAFDLPGTGQQAREALRKRAATMVDHCVDVSLKTFLLRAADPALPLDRWLSAIATLLTRQPPKDWSDRNLDEFQVALADIRLRLLNLEPLVMEAYRAQHDWETTEILSLGVTSLQAEERRRMLFVDADRSDEVHRLRKAVTDALRANGAADRPDIVLSALALVAQRVMADDDDTAEGGQRGQG
jgi:hypothetical protein